MKENKKNKILSLIVLIIGILLIGISISLLFINDNSKNDNNNMNSIEEDNNNNDNNNDNNNPEVEKEIEFGEKELNALTNLPSINENLYEEPLYSVYQDKKVDAKNVDSKIIVATAISKLEDHGECSMEDWQINDGLCNLTYSTNDIEEKIKELYGNNQYSLPEKVNGSSLLHCTLNNDRYACSNSGGGFSGKYVNYFGIIYDYANLTKNVKVTKTDKNLYIYQEYAKIGLEVLNDGDKNNLDNLLFRAYKYSNSDELVNSKTFLGKDYYEEGENITPFFDKLSEELKGQLTMFKHTFEINENGNYIWISTEEVK